MSKLTAVVEKVYQQNNYTLDAEVLNVLLHPAQHKLISAPAGGTKTTLTQLMVELERLNHLLESYKHNKNAASPLDRVLPIIPKSRILCIVYNRHNAGDIETVNAKMANTLIGMRVISADPSAVNYSESGVTATTMHGFADKVVKDNLGLLKLRSFNLAKESSISALFSKSVEKVLENNDSSLRASKPLIDDAKQLYELYVGLQLYKTDKEKPLTDSVQFELVLQNMEIPSKYLREIFELYDKRKKAMKLYEFSDMLRLCDQLFEIEQVRNHYQNYFEIVVADEVQDFTPLMFSIYRNLVGPNTKTITVGDSNQSIYSFLGAERDAINNFENIMGFSPERFQLSVNRRCRKYTMPFALNTLALNNFDTKTIVTNKPDGELQRIEFKTLNEQLQIIRDVMMKRVSGSMGILFRNKDQSIMLSRYLYENKIQANYINAKSFSEHTLYTMFIDLIQELFINKTQRGLSMLNRIMPFGKEAVNNFFDFDEKSGVSRTCPHSQLWHTLDFSSMYSSRNYFSAEDQMEFLKSVAADSTNVIASDVIPRLLEMFFYNFYAHLPNVKDDEFIESVLVWAEKDLATGFRLQKAIDDLNLNVQRYVTRGRRLGKLNISTIHGTKGLEFNHVILNLEGERGIKKRDLSPAALKFQEEEENRLYYVAGTRQIDSLTVLVNTDNKHRLSDPKLFEGEEKPLTKPVFNDKFSGELNGGLSIGEVVPRSRARGRKRSLLEE